MEITPEELSTVQELYTAYLTLPVMLITHEDRITGTTYQSRKVISFMQGLKHKYSLPDNTILDLVTGKLSPPGEAK